MRSRAHTQRTSGLTVPTTGVALNTSEGMQVMEYSTRNLCGLCRMSIYGADSSMCTCVCVCMFHDDKRLSLHNIA